MNPNCSVTMASHHGREEFTSAHQVQAFVAEPDAATVGLTGMVLFAKGPTQGELPSHVQSLLS